MTRIVFPSWKEAIVTMVTDEGEIVDATTMDRVMADVREELVRRVAKRNRDEHRDIYDALDSE